MLQNPRNITFSEKKAPAAVHHTHTGHKNPRNVIFSEKKAPAAVHHTRTLLGDHKTDKNIPTNKTNPEIY
jgi:hypothetical protein